MYTKLNKMTTADFYKLVVTQSDSLKPYAISLTKDKEDADDLFQDTIVRALSNKDKYRIGTNIKAWLYTIMRNIFINNYRKNKKFTKVANEDNSDAYVYTYNHTAPNYGWNNMRMKEIQNAMDKLPNSFRQSFEMYYMGYKYQEISSLLNEPLGTVKSRIHFARKQLVTAIDR